MEQNSSSTSSTQAPEATTSAASTSEASTSAASTSATSTNVASTNEANTNEASADAASKSTTITSAVTTSEASTCATTTSLASTSPARTSKPSTNASSGSFDQPSTSSLVMPSRILAMSKQSTEAISTQTNESRKHKSSDISPEKVQMNKRSKNDESPCSTASTSSLSSLSSLSSSTSSSSHAETGTQTLSSRRVLFINDRSEPSTSAGLSTAFNQKGKSGVRIMCPKLSKRKVRATALSTESNTASSTSNSTATTGINAPQPSTSRNNTEELFRNFRPIAEEVRNRCLPIIKSLPACDRPKLLR